MGAALWARGYDRNQLEFNATVIEQLHKVAREDHEQIVGRVASNKLPGVDRLQARKLHGEPFGRCARNLTTAAPFGEGEADEEADEEEAEEEDEEADEKAERDEAAGATDAADAPTSPTLPLPPPTKLARALGRPRPSYCLPHHRQRETEAAADRLWWHLRQGRERGREKAVGMLNSCLSGRRAALVGCLSHCQATDWAQPAHC